MIQTPFSYVRRVLIFSLLLVSCSLGEALAIPITIEFSGIVTSPQSYLQYKPELNMPKEFVAGNPFTGTLTWDYLLISDFIQSGSNNLALFDQNHVLGISLTLGNYKAVLNDKPVASLSSDNNGKGSFFYGSEGGTDFVELNGTGTAAWFEYVSLHYDYNDGLAHDTLLPPDPDKMILTSLHISGGPFWRLDGTIYPESAPGPAPVPEPSTLLLLGSGLGGWAMWRKKRIPPAA